MHQWHPKRIVVPTDFSQQAMAGLDVAIRFAAESASRIFLIHVIDTTRLRPGRTLSLVRTQARKHLGRLCRMLHANGVDVVPLLEVGDPHQEIARAARAARADLIIMSGKTVNGRGGDTSRSVLTQAPCEVWNVRVKPMSFRRIRASVGRSIPVKAAG